MGDLGARAHPGQHRLRGANALGPPVADGGCLSHPLGLEHDVQPGTVWADRPRSVASLASPRALAARHPALVVRLDHQP
ncbi:MAG TPA: hypothetical protein VGP07_08140 [Polyangia bacterium]